MLWRLLLLSEGRGHLEESQAAQTSTAQSYATARRPLEEQKGREEVQLHHRFPASCIGGKKKKKN